MEPSIARLKAIAKHFGLLEAADKWHADMQHDANDACQYASCVCAAAFDAHRTKDYATAERICAEVWADEDLAAERTFRERRDTTLEIFDNFKIGPFVQIEIKNRYAFWSNDVVVVLQCTHCGNIIEKRYKTLLSHFQMRCVSCRAYD
ncbi:MAG: hypothetical protein IKW49_08630 [Opitutales bacterium]|nr:hypothetical protein [Opitutales bacterium]